MSSYVFLGKIFDMLEFQADRYLTLLRPKDTSSTSQLLWNTSTHQSVTHQGEHEPMASYFTSIDKFTDSLFLYRSWQNAEGKFSFAKAPLHTTWRAMESLVDDGLAKSIGVSNYSAPLMMDLERYARIMPATLQIEHHPYLRQKRESCIYHL